MSSKPANKGAYTAPACGAPNWSRPPAGSPAAVPPAAEIWRWRLGPHVHQTPWPAVNAQPYYYPISRVLQSNGLSSYLP